MEESTEDNLSAQSAQDPGLWKSWLADVDGCFSCQLDHRGVLVTIDRRLGDWFACPNTLQQVRARDPGNRSVSIATAMRELPDGQPDGLSTDGRVRTRLHAMENAPVMRSDREALGMNVPVMSEVDSDFDDDEGTEAELTDDDIRESLKSFSEHARRTMYDALRSEFELTENAHPELSGDNFSGPVYREPYSDVDAPKENSYQVGGKHYGLRAFQHWDIVAMFNLDYFQGQVTKYIMRWRDKNGIEDLEKAKHYLEKYIAVEKDKAKKLYVANWKDEPANTDVNPFGAEPVRDPQTFRTRALTPDETKDVVMKNVDPIDPQEGAS